MTTLGNQVEIRRYNPESVAAPIGAYSHLVSVAGPVDWVFISGQVGVDTDGSIPEDIYTQTQNTLRNIENLMRAVGGTPESVVRLMSLLVGPENMPEYSRGRNEIYGLWYPDGDVPGHSLAIVSALAKPELLIEIEGWFVLPARGSVNHSS